MLFILVMK